MEIKELRKGMRVTLISKGIRRSDYSDNEWIDSEIKGRASFLEITKVGTKYIYGFGFYYEPEIKKNTKACYEHKELASDSVIILGFNEEAKIRYDDYREAIRNYEEIKHKADYEIDHKIQKIKDELVIILGFNEEAKIRYDEQRQWRKNNPRPKPLEI